MPEAPAPDAASSVRPAPEPFSGQAPMGNNGLVFSQVPAPDVAPSRFPAAENSLSAAAPQLPVVDLIGLRFSLQHLRLVGYGLLAVWISEIVNLLTSPGVGEVGTRLHYTSQFLDLSPILLVAIGLIAFQGGLRRRSWEVGLLPLLFTVLPLLSAFYFFLAPVSVANAITLAQKQQQIGLDQIEQIDRQVDRATSILKVSDSIDTLLSGLQRIPGLQVRVPPKASVADAREEVRRSLERERERLQERISRNVTNSRDAFLRRAFTNALLALVVGLLLWGLHHGAMREMELAIPFLDWVLVHGEVTQQPEALQELLRFQRACIALGWFALLERVLRVVRRVVRRRSTEDVAEEERQEEASQQPPANPFDRPPAHRFGILAAQRPLLSLLVPSFLPLEPAVSGSAEASEPVASSHEAGSRAAASPPETASLAADRAAAVGPTDPWAGLEESSLDPHPAAEVMRRSREAEQSREARRRQRDLERYRRHRRRLERDGLDPFLLIGASHPEGFDPESPAGPAFSEDPDPLAASAFPDPFPQAPELLNAPEFSAVVDPHAVPETPPLTPRQLRRLEREHRRAREALQRMAESDEMLWLQVDHEALEQDLREEVEWEIAEHQRRLPAEGPPGPPRGLGGLWRWFLTHI